VIEHHWNQGQKPHLKHCWLICTNQSLPYAQKMIKKLTDTGMTQTVEFHYGNYELEDPEHPEQKLNLLVPDEVVDDPNYIRRLVNGIYADAKHQGLEESQLIADYTGATKSMTVGIVLACTAPERQLQYVSQVTDPQMMQVKFPTNSNPLKKANYTDSSDFKEQRALLRKSSPSHKASLGQMRSLLTIPLPPALPKSLLESRKLYLRDRHPCAFDLALKFL
jgi:hypothetical protein